MASDMFLKIDGIPGESTDKAHANEIEVLSFSWGIQQQRSGSASSGEASRPGELISRTSLS